MDVSLAAFVAELRAIGLPVSVSENVDAAAAVAIMPMVDRASLKSALAATLVKNSDHYGAFELVFDVFFGGRRIGADAQAGPAADGPDADADAAAAGGPGAAGNGAGPGRSVVAMLSDAELADLLLRAVLTGDRMLIRAVAAEAVTR
jgi:uncharacterized protein with von Willebrand factor type A (vWA) domain